MTDARIYLSPPDVSDVERKLLLEAFDSNWVAQVGPDLNAYEEQVADLVGVQHAVALSSGRARLSRLPRAVVTVDMYGQCADYDPLLAACDQYGVALIQDAAEALGATYRGRAAGSFGLAGVLSFNGNKIIIITTGGMLGRPTGETAYSTVASSIPRSR